MRHHIQTIGTVLMCAVWALGCGENNKPIVTPLPDMGDMMDATPDMMKDQGIPNYLEPPDGPLTGIAPMRLLTRVEYDLTVSDLLGISSEEATKFPAENVAGGFVNNAWVHKVSPSLVRFYQTAAEVLGKESAQNPPADLMPCAGDTPDKDACLAALEPFLTRAYRRPVMSEELSLMQALYEKALEDETPLGALEVVLQATLLSPQFLYRIELFEPSTVAENPRDGGMNADDYEPVGPYEIASRLSYFLWNTMPDADLMEAAETGKLNTPEELERQFLRMTMSPRFMDSVQNFHRQWLHLDGFEAMTRDGNLYPEFSPELAHDLGVSLNAFIAHVYQGENTLDELLRSKTVFLTPRLAELYEKEQKTGLWAEAFPEAERSGLLTQPAMMALLSYPNQSSPINRAVFIREKILCQPVPPPPNNPGVEIVPPDPDPSLTTRESFAIHTADPTCAGCHSMIDNLGFGFEAYDALGRYRTVENGKPVDVSGELVNTAEESINKKFEGGVELSQLLQNSRAVEECIAHSWFTYAMGRQDDKSDKDSFSAILEEFRGKDRRFDALIKAIIMSDSFRFRLKRAQADKIAREQFSSDEGGM